MTDIVQDEKKRLRGLTLEETEELVVSGGFERFRGRQLFHWVQRKAARSFEEMKNIPAPLRQWLCENTVFGGVKQAIALNTSQDGSYKFLFELEDGRKVESVLMPDPKRNYWTQCLSSQVGCAVDCKFCVTGFNGFFRQMRVDEIVDQVLFARRHLQEQQPEANYRNLVYMGMGEPLLNTDAVIQSIRVLTAIEGVDLSPRRITVSTSGIIPGMIQLAESGVDVNLALSLNAPSQEEREAIMPITKKYPLADLLDVCRKYKFGKNKRILMEYVLLSGVNDQEEHAHKLRKLLRGLSCKVNLIPFNPNPILPYGRPEQEDIDRFAKILLEDHFTVSVRWSKALDVDGACGQLAGQHRQRRERPTAEVAAAALAPSAGDLDFFAPVSADEGDEEG